jgi:nitrate/TMAO reductase-like tetraheme cytochrome c subunit
MLKGFVGFVVRATGDVLGLIAVVVITISSIALIALIGVQITSGELSPYLGILTYMVLPAGFIGGLVLLAIARWRVRRALARGSDVPWRLDLNNPAHRERLGVVLALSVINVIILALTAYHGVHYMDSTSFCGEVCHQVMEPEFAAYQNSPHARVSCTDCHIGPGANWFVRSKLSGSRQVLAVAFGTYPQPVPAPIENLRPARETCEQCHWPAKFHGDRMKVLSRFQEDEENTELKTVLVLKVGGGSLESGFAEGIHWHMNLANHVEHSIGFVSRTWTARFESTGTTTPTSIATPSRSSRSARWTAWTATIARRTVSTVRRRHSTTYSARGRSPTCRGSSARR